MKQLWYNLKAWVCMYMPVQPPEIPKEHLTVEELLEKFAPSDEAEWEDDE